MGKRLEYTPNSKIRQALRIVWLRSRERGKALKRDKNTCVRCGRKASVAKGKEFKVEVHHKHMIDWEGVCQLIRERVLQTPDDLETLCKECHGKEEHKSEEKTKGRTKVDADILGCSHGNSCTCGSTVQLSAQGGKVCDGKGTCCKG